MSVATAKKLIVAVGMLGLAALVAAPADATTFLFQDIGGFEFTTDVTTAGAQHGVHFDTASGFVINGHNTYGGIGWGNGFVGPSDVAPIGGTQSALFLSTVLSGNIADNGVPVLVSTLTHRNQPIAPPKLTQVTISAQLSLFAGPGLTNPVGAPAFPNPNSIPIFFTETSNVGPANGSGCTDEAFPGAPLNPLGTVCDDFLQFLPSGFNPLHFIVNGVAYVMTFSLVPEPLSFALCDLPDGTCWTGENHTNAVDIFAALTRVPAPASLALLGLGLMGLGAISLKRRQAQP